MLYLTRRKFLSLSETSAIGFGITSFGVTPVSNMTLRSLGTLKSATYTQLPRWRGFNSHEKDGNDIPHLNKGYTEAGTRLALPQ